MWLKGVMKIVSVPGGWGFVSVVWVVSRVSSGRVYRHSSETKEKGSKEMADRREERAIVHVAQLYVASSRPSHQCSDACVFAQRIR